MSDPVALRDLEIRHLRALEAVARTGTFGRAADDLGYTQSAVSQQIGALERLVGERLFDRPGGPRPVELTPLGRVMLRHAREVLGRVEAAVQDVRRYRAGESGAIRIGTFESVSVALLPRLLGQLRREHPDVRIELFETDEESVLHTQLLAGELDVSFLAARGPSGLVSLPLFEDPWVVVLRDVDAPDGDLPLHRLNGVDLVGQLQADVSQQAIDEGLRAAGIAPRYLFRTGDNAAMLAMVREGMGLAIMPRLAVEHALPPHVATRLLDPPLPPRTVTIAWPRGRTRSPTTARFVDLARGLAEDRG